MNHFQICRCIKIRTKDIVIVIDNVPIGDGKENQIFKVLVKKLGMKSQTLWTL